MIKLAVHKTLHGQEGAFSLDLNLNMADGHLVTIYGTSGAGKTTILKLLSGLMTPESGEVIVNGETWFSSKEGINLKPQERSIGYVFQDFALFPNMTIRQNLVYALDRKQEKDIVDQLITVMELEDLQHRKPDTLSGGQKQRVALARALVRKPKLLLLDEPLSALDVKMRLKLQEYIRQVHRDFELTTILVSHDIGEIHRLSDWVYEINNGKIIREGSPSGIFENDTLSGKFKLTGEVLKIEKQDVIYVVSVLIQNNVTRVIAEASEVEDLKPGDHVVVASKAFNPIIYKVDY